MKHSLVRRDEECLVGCRQPSTTDPECAEGTDQEIVHVRDRHPLHAKAWNTCVVSHGLFAAYCY